jgi:hypothetical protein
MEGGLMGQILGSKVKDDGKIIFEVLVEHEEALQLKGHVDNIHLFSENVGDIEVATTQRGANDATTYFLVPKDLRPPKKITKARCQMITTKTKTMYVYVIDRIGLR